MRDIGADRRAIIGAGALLGTGLLGARAEARPSEAGTGWASTADADDAWLDKPDTRHRLVFDTTSASAAETASFYANNFYTANKSGYGIEPDALGVVIILRHMSTPFGFNDAIWKKYGTGFAKQLKLEGDQAIRAVNGNPLLSAPAPAPAAKPDKPAKGEEDEVVTLATLAAKGTRFAVCGMATHGMAGMLAKTAGLAADDVEKDLKANLIPGGIIVPAGVVAINRAQEHGYAFAYVA